MKGREMPDLQGESPGARSYYTVKPLVVIRRALSRIESHLAQRHHRSYGRKVDEAAFISSAVFQMRNDDE